MDIKITPKKLCGEVTVPPSKSVAHRLIICASLAQGVSVIENIYPSKDIIATAQAMNSLGANVELSNNKAKIVGIKNLPQKTALDCDESGSTLRFLIPVVCALGVKTVFTGNLRSKLPTRPITPYLEELPRHGVEFNYNGTMPFTVKGKLLSGEYKMSGDVSSQFITGLIFALSLLDDDSEIVLTTPLQSKPYVDITISAMREFGVEVLETKKGYYIKGNQKYMWKNISCEGDFSQAGFYYVANSLGSDIKISGLCKNSSQGDKKIVEICEKIVYNKNGKLNGFTLDCSDIPDLVPILTVLACFCEGKSVIENVARLKIKECDRLLVTEEVLNKIGGKVKAFEDRLEIQGVKEFLGGEIDAHNDHRIAMAMAIASTKCKKPLIIRGAECVGKSYPNFWEHFQKLGGDFCVI